MPANLPAVAACLHCRSILVALPGMLAHPAPEERRTIHRALDAHWCHHDHTTFDGRFHQCYPRPHGLVQRDQTNVNNRRRQP